MMSREPCGCTESREKSGRETVSLCAQHRAEFDARHQAAVASCSHVYREQQEPQWK